MLYIHYIRYTYICIHYISQFNWKNFNLSLSLTLNKNLSISHMRQTSGVRVCDRRYCGAMVTHRFTAHVCERYLVRYLREIEFACSVTFDDNIANVKHHCAVIMRRVILTQRSLMWQQHCRQSYWVNTQGRWPTPRKRPYCSNFVRSLAHRRPKCRHDRKPSRASGQRGCQGRRGAKRGGMYDAFISYRLKGSAGGGGKQPVVAMATEPAPCELDVYLNARELRDVIFAPLFCRSLPAPHLGARALRRGCFRR